MRFVWWRIKHRAQINSTSQPVKAWLLEFRHITDTKYSYSGGGGIMRCVHICSTKVIITLLYIIDIHPHITHITPIIMQVRYNSCPAPATQQTLHHSTLFSIQHGDLYQSSTLSWPIRCESIQFPPSKTYIHAHNLNSG